MARTALAASGLLLIICALTIGTRRGMRAPSFAEFQQRWAAVHAVPVSTVDRPLVRGWLRITRVVAAPLVRLGCHPDWLTAIGLWAGAVVAVTADGGRGGAAVAAVVVVVSVAADALDGAVAVLSDRASRFGAVLDSVADRAVDALWVVALVLAGGRVEWAPPPSVRRPHWSTSGRGASPWCPTGAAR